LLLTISFKKWYKYFDKIDQNVVESRMTYELRDGKCEPNEKIISDI
jgi:hypothetical protein